MYENNLKVKYYTISTGDRKLVIVKSNGLNFQVKNLPPYFIFPLMFLFLNLFFNDFNKQKTNTQTKKKFFLFLFTREKNLKRHVCNMKKIKNKIKNYERLIEIKIKRKREREEGVFE